MKEQKQKERWKKRIANAEQDLQDAREHGNAEDISYCEYMVAKYHRMAKINERFWSTMKVANNELDKLSTITAKAHKTIK